MWWLKTVQLLCLYLWFAFSAINPFSVRCLGTWLCACDLRSDLLVSNALLCERHSVYSVIIGVIMFIVCVTLIMSEMFTLFWIVRCTINPGENEALVRYALDTYKFLSLVQQVRFQILLSFVMTLEMMTRIWAAGYKIDKYISGRKMIPIFQSLAKGLELWDYTNILSTIGLNLKNILPPLH